MTAAFSARPERTYRGMTTRREMEADPVARLEQRMVRFSGSSWLRMRVAVLSVKSGWNLCLSAGSMVISRLETMATGSGWLQCPRFLRTSLVGSGK